MIILVGFLGIWGVVSILVAYGNARSGNIPAAVASFIVGAAALLLAWKLA